jgi:hypothetical protein
MDQSWGRESSAGTWINTRPIWALSAVLIAVVSAIGLGQYRYSRWTPLQQFYFPAYVRSTLIDALGVTRPGRYALLTVRDRRGPRLAVDADVVATPGSSRDGFTLTAAARSAGIRGPAVTTDRYDPRALHTFLLTWIYQGRRLRDLAWPPLMGGLGVLVLGLVIAIPQDAALARRRRQGRRLRGPELVTPRAFTQRLRADGVGWRQARRWFSLSRPTWVRVPHALESSHLLVMGDTGTGKSSLIRQVLLQVQARGETAIIYDPALEYTPQFFDPDRGDAILNPLDRRTPFWTPADELRLDAEALTLAESLFPEREDKNSFFSDAPRRIMAFLLTHRPDAAQIVAWLSDPRELDRLLAGTPYAVMIDPSAGPQRAGVLASLNMVADALQLLPAAGTTSQRWSATDWSTTRRGWLFFTSTPETRARLVPLTSLWLDTLVLRLMNQAQPTSRRTWFVIDELASLQRLPQLHTAMTEARKSNSPLVLGFQGRSQVAKRYGLDAEAMLSQPATKIFLRTSEPDAAKWISQTLGDVETERLKQSRSSADGWATTARHSTSYALERQVEPLVLPSQVGGLANLQGYLKHGNLVTTLRVPFIKLPERHPALVPRPVFDAIGPVCPRPPRAAADPPVNELAPAAVPQHAGYGHSSFD